MTTKPKAPKPATFLIRCPAMATKDSPKGLYLHKGFPVPQWAIDLDGAMKVTKQAFSIMCKEWQFLKTCEAVSEDEEAVASLSPSAKSLLAGFDEAAKYHGMMLEYGSGPNVDKAKVQYDAAKLALAKYIRRLEEVL